MMPGMTGMELMLQTRETVPNAAFILLTAFGTVENATQAMRQGAYDYLTKPVDLNRLKIVIEKALERVNDREEVLRLTWDLAEQGRFGRLIGRSPPMRQVYRLIEQAAPSKAAVLLTGESGTGKEVVAGTLHEMSARRAQPFVAVNCAAIPGTLLESEMFGHEKGSFTGADTQRQGCFERANGGTLLLDEIGEMSPDLQAKLLRVLEEKVIRRVGGWQELPVDVRVISSTNVDITQALRAGRFREDLFYRLNVFTIPLPPLRERRQDIPLLAKHFMEEFATANGKSMEDISPAALNALARHTWPGNVREFRNVMERAVIVAHGPFIDLVDLAGLTDFTATSPPPAVVFDPAAVAAAAPPRPAGNSITLAIGSTVEEAEKQLILETLRVTGDNKTRAAEVLGISPRTLHNKLRRYGHRTLN